VGAVAEPGRQALLTSDPAVSVIILNFNGAHYLGDCVGAVLDQQLDRNFEILVVDNDSQDGSAALARGLPGVRVVLAPRNLGFAGGNNLGIRHARGQQIVLLNNDTRVHPGWLQALVDASASVPRVGAVTSRLAWADSPSRIQNAGLLLLSDGSGGDRGVNEPTTDYGERCEVFGFCGAAALLERSALADVGVFDARYFMYYEDLDLSWRMRLRGWRILYEPRAEVEHVHAASSREWSELFVFHADRNRVLTLVKNARWRFLWRCLGQLAARAAGPEGTALRARRSVRGRLIVSLAFNLWPALLQRWRIRLRRRLADSDIESWAYPRATWDDRSK